MLAHRRLYVVGCPAVCQPVVEDDVVAETSSPYFYNDYQIDCMYAAFLKREVAIRSRTPGTSQLIPLFTLLSATRTERVIRNNRRWKVNG